MSGLEFTAALVGSLAWPGVVVLIVAVVSTTRVAAAGYSIAPAALPVLRIADTK